MNKNITYEHTIEIDDEYDIYLNYDDECGIGLNIEHDLDFEQLQKVASELNKFVNYIKKDKNK